MNMHQIFWHEGQFVKPQHFQLQSSFCIEYCNKLFSFLREEAWGIIKIKYALTITKPQIFSINECEVIFPDGSLIVYPGNAAIEPKYISDQLFGHGSTLELYLVLSDDLECRIDSIHGNDRGNVNDHRKQLKSRFVPEHVDVKDTHDFDRVDRISVLTYQCEILTCQEFKDAPVENAIKLLELTSAGETIVESGSFIAPAICVQGIDSLNSLVLNIRKSLSFSLHRLRSYDNPRQKNSDSGSDGRSMTLIQVSLNRTLCLINQMLRKNVTCPSEIYNVLKILYSELLMLIPANASDTDDAVEGYQYSKHNIFESFVSLEKAVTGLIESIFQEGFSITTLKYDGTYYGAAIEAAELQGSCKNYLKLSGMEGVPDVIEKLQFQAKVSSREYLPFVIARSLPGVKLVHAKFIPGPMTYDSGSCYFEIQQSGDAWRRISEDKNVAIFADLLPDHVNIDFLSVKS